MKTLAGIREKLFRLACSTGTDNQFWRFHYTNPHVYELFKKYAYEVMRSGHRHYGTNAIINRMRWHMDIETLDSNGNDNFKINNNYASRYSRLLALNEPMFRGFFRNRKLKTFSTLENYKWMYRKYN